MRFMGCIAGALCLLSAQSANAGYWCDEKVTAAIVHQDGTVYFMSEKSCLAWCAISPAWAQPQIDRAYSTLITAISQNKPITMFWTNASTPCAQVAMYSNPEAFIFHP
ncbi:hypothetical protein [Sphingomonas hengshuiensis]|uniref:Uncharacterized protein n=1 Tax=Sphingomonas hengshuiensis TaxID=1609977 RepID=A0A7U5BE47_9SPHN|nr:hypothetical protein [Sphingomonas hengshuiensis]AJP70587.1 hypothetical protein TS85_00195 [Sphingomonas hengshuiensis]